MIKEEGEAAILEVGAHGIHPELVRLLGKMKFRTSYGQNALKHSIEVAQLSGLLAAEMGLDVRVAKRAGLQLSLTTVIKNLHLLFLVLYRRLTLFLQLVQVQEEKH